MRVLVCGGRDFDDPVLMEHTLRNLPSPSLIVTGAQRKYDKAKGRWIGADWQAIEWAQRNEVPFMGVPAKWTRDGKAAGPIRNALMLEKVKPDVVVAMAGGIGTADMVERARAAGIEVRFPSPTRKDEPGYRNARTAHEPQPPPPERAPDPVRARQQTAA